MIQFITHANDRYNYLDGVRIALEGGCRWIQLRMKDASEEEVLKTAESTRKLCRQYDAVFLLDDYVELVERSGADGVHLGKDDMPIDEARRLLGKDKIIGGTANTFEDVKRYLFCWSRLHWLRSIPLYYYQEKAISYLRVRCL